MAMHGLGWCRSRWGCQAVVVASDACDLLSQRRMCGLARRAQRILRSGRLVFSTLDAARRIAVEIAPERRACRTFTLGMSLQRDGQVVDYASRRQSTFTGAGGAGCGRWLGTQERTQLGMARSSTFGGRYLPSYCTRPNGSCTVVESGTRRIRCRRSWSNTSNQLLSAAGIPAPDNPNHVLFSPGIYRRHLPLKSIEV